MNGLYLQLAQEEKHIDHERKEEWLSLLAKKGNFEVMTQRVVRGAAVWLYPAENENDLEFFFIHTGKMEIVLSDQDVRQLGPGDSFYTQGLQQNVLMRCMEDALLLYVSTCPAFDEQYYWQRELQSLLRRVDANDHNTKRHSQAVMQYAVLLYEALEEQLKDIQLEEFVVAALFHDVGKCNVPGEILRKRERLTTEEYDLVKLHPRDSSIILKPMYGERIASIALMHHERMDGSGYPQGLKGDEIPLEARILMVADSFDAMITDRGYNKVMTLEEAVAEIVKQDQLFDPLVAKTLKMLLDSGKIQQVLETQPE